MIEGKIELQNIHIWFTQDIEKATGGVLCNQLIDLSLAQAALASDTRSLEVGPRGRDVRVKARSRTCHQVGRDRDAGILFLQGSNALLNARDQLLIRRPEIEALEFSAL